MSNYIKIKCNPLLWDVEVPKYQTNGAAGFDLAAAENCFVDAGCTVLIRTGLAFEIPDGFEMQIRPRSGLSLKTDLRIANAPGTIDSDYRGEVKIIVTNTSRTMEYTIEKGDRIAQGVICPVYRADFEEVFELSDTERGSNGFGSTNT